MPYLQIVSTLTRIIPSGGNSGFIIELKILKKTIFIQNSHHLNIF